MLFTARIFFLTDYTQFHLNLFRSLQKDKHSSRITCVTSKLMLFKIVESMFNCDIIEECIYYG